MNFLADMGISPKTVRYLSGRGHDAIHLAELGLHRLPDPDILDLARDQERILLTHDLDFGELMAFSKATLPSVIIFRLSDMTPANVNRYLDAILDVQTAELRQGLLISVSDRGIRSRSLPI